MNEAIRRRRLPICLAALLAAATACGEAESASPHFFFPMTAGDVSIKLGEVNLEIPGHLLFCYGRGPDSPGGRTPQLTIQGHPFVVRDGVLVIGRERYATPPGARVRVSNRGVSVDGELRGALPEVAFWDLPEPEGELVIETAGVRLQLSDEILRREVQEAGPDAGSLTRLTIRGHPFRVRAGELWIGERSYGPTPSGARVQVSAAGVRVEGEQRGPLPEEITDPAD